MPEEINPEWATWRMEDLPLDIQRFDYVLDDRGDLGQLKKRQFFALKQSLPDFDEVVIATDDDREGEVIGWLPLTLLGYKGPVKRITYSQIDVKAFRVALDNIREGATFKNRFHEGLARAAIDMIVGLNASRVTALAFGQDRSDIPTSAGRVQTPVLNLVGERCDEIANFVSQPYYEFLANGTVDGLELELAYAPEDKILDAGEAERISQTIPDTAELFVRHEDKRTSPPKLFNLNALQGAASTQFGFSPAKTLEIINKLYVAGILTYPRGLPRVLPEAMSSDTGSLLYHLAKIDELETGGLASLIAGHGFSYRKEVYNDREMAGHSHHAIIPNPNRIEATTLNLSSLEPDEQKIFLLVARVFIAAHLPDYCYKATVIGFEHEGKVFKTQIDVPVSQGWKAIYDEADDADEETSEGETRRSGVLPDIKSGDVFRAIETTIVSKKTRPQKFYSVKSLLAKMAALGLGAPSTFDKYETTLRNRMYIEGPQAKVEVTTRGQESLKFWRTYAEILTSPDLTIEIEARLAALLRGEVAYADVLTYAREMTGAIVRSIKDAPPGSVDLERVRVSRPPSIKLRRYVKKAAEIMGVGLPSGILSSASACSAWLETHKAEIDDAFSKPSEKELWLVDAILNGNPDLVFPDQDRSSREKISAFISAHREHARPAPSEKMLAYAQKRADELGVQLPLDARRYNERLAEWLKDHPVPPSAKQLDYARKVASVLGIELPEHIEVSSDICRVFLDEHADKAGSSGGTKGGGSRKGMRRRATSRKQSRRRTG
jgi:DNA topoisomerase-3